MVCIDTLISRLYTRIHHALERVKKLRVVVAGTGEILAHCFAAADLSHKERKRLPGKLRYLLWIDLKLSRKSVFLQQKDVAEYLVRRSVGHRICALDIKHVLQFLGGYHQPQLSIQAPLRSIDRRLTCAQMGAHGYVPHSGR
jgi:hypothetical protein